MLSVYNACKHLRHNLSYELANYVWYKRLPPSILKSTPYGRTTIDSEPVSCLGAKYTRLINYRDEIEHYLWKKDLCRHCLVQASTSKTSTDRTFGKALCNTCLPLLGIRKYNSHIIDNVPANVLSLALDALQRLLEDHMNMEAFQHLRIETSKKLLYRPSVDAIVRQHTSHGLADFELAAKEEQVNSIKHLYHVHPLRQQHESLRRRLIDATQHIYTYVGQMLLAPDEVRDKTAPQRYEELCEQLQASPCEEVDIKDVW